MLPTLQQIIEKSGIHPYRVFNVYLFGSQIYRTATEKSDWDVIMVANNSVESTEVRNGLFNIHVYVPDKFAQDLRNHRINNLECIFAPKWAKLLERIDYSDFKVRKEILRHSLARTSSNSWVKSKKKILVENEDYIGLKSLFHSIRIPMFGTQISKSGSITDFSCANYIWDDIKYDQYSWQELDDKYRPVLNSVMSEFRQSSPKI
jgi:predicted nucleotidyltransferase